MSKDKNKVEPKKNDYVDLLAQSPKFVIFTKNNRVQIINEPTEEQIRKRGKTRWKIAFVTDNVDEARATLGQLV